MTKHEELSMLKSAGFVLVRFGTKHEIYAKGEFRYSVSRNPSSRPPRQMANLRTLIRRASKKV